MCVSPAWAACLLFVERVQGGTSSGLSTPGLGEPGRRDPNELSQTEETQGTALVWEEGLGPGSAACDTGVWNPVTPPPLQMHPRT